VKKWAGLEVVPFADEFDPDDKNAQWHIDYCYWDAKPNPEAANEKIPQKLMIKSFPENYYMTGSKDYGNGIADMDTPLVDVEEEDSETNNTTDAGNSIANDS
jgi:hypothetical protein